MIIQTKDLQPHMMVIYKINYPNGKIYIGLTTDLQRRMWEHNNGKRQVCDKAIQKYGKITEIEILEFVNNPELLEEREAYWINKYQSYKKEIGYNLTKGGDGSKQFGERNHRAVFSNNEVFDIRKRRYFGERKKDVYKDYSNYSFATFEKIWLGKGYDNIGIEFLIKPNSKTRQEYSKEANSGIKNGRAKCSVEQVKDIRKRYKRGESFSDINKIYPNLSKSTIRRIAIRESYKDVK